MARLGVGAWAACLLALSCALITSSSAQGSAAAEHSAQAASQPAQVPHNPLDLWRVENVQLAAQPGAKLWTSAAELHASGEWLEVFWSGVVRPRPDDLIALYVPATADPRKAAPVKFQWADRAATHRSVGAGTLRCGMGSSAAECCFDRAACTAFDEREPPHPPAIHTGVLCSLGPAS